MGFLKVGRKSLFWGFKKLAAMYIVYGRLIVFACRLLCDEWLEIKFQCPDMAHMLVSSVIQLRSTWESLLKVRLEGTINCYLILIFFSVCFLLSLVVILFCFCWGGWGWGRRVCFPFCECVCVNHICDDFLY